MKPGERLVWAAAFAQVIATVDDPAADLRLLLTKAVCCAHLAVRGLRAANYLATNNATGENAEAWAMAQDMAGSTN